MLTLIKTLAFIWPFLKEMILGDKSLKDAVKNNKFRVAIIGMIFLSVIMSFFAVPKLITISLEHIQLQKRMEATMKRNQATEINNPDPPTVLTPNDSKDPPEPMGPPAPVQTPNEQERYEKSKAFFERMHRDQRN